MREDGYYWIKLTEHSEWEVSLYENGSFALIANEFAFYTDNEVFEIDEKRIVK